jgi:hypothetical protein
MKNGDKPISVLYGADGTLFKGQGDDESYIKETSPLIGLTKRETFAMAAMQGILASKPERDYISIESSVTIAAVMYADELLRQLEKK